MSRKVTIRPGKFQSIIGFITGCVFCGVGIYIIIRGSGAFGIVWTLFAFLITVTNGINAFTSRRIGAQSVEIEDELIDTDLRNFYTESEVEERLIQLKDLFEKNLITQDEYTAKKAEVLSHL